MCAPFGFGVRVAMMAYRSELSVRSVPPRLRNLEDISSVRLFLPVPANTHLVTEKLVPKFWGCGRKAADFGMVESEIRGGNERERMVRVFSYPLISRVFNFLWTLGDNNNKK